MVSFSRDPPLETDPFEIYAQDMLKKESYNNPEQKESLRIAFTDLTKKIKKRTFALKTLERHSRTLSSRNGWRAKGSLIIFRTKEAIKSIFGKSDWQKSNEILSRQQGEFLYPLQTEKSIPSKKSESSDSIDKNNPSNISLEEWKEKLPFLRYVKEGTLELFQFMTEYSDRFNTSSPIDANLKTLMESIEKIKKGGELLEEEKKKAILAYFELKITCIKLLPELGCSEKEIEEVKEIFTSMIRFCTPPCIQYLTDIFAPCIDFSPYRSELIEDGPKNRRFKRMKKDFENEYGRSLDFTQEGYDPFADPKGFLHVNSLGSREELEIQCEKEYGKDPSSYPEKCSSIPIKATFTFSVRAKDLPSSRESSGSCKIDLSQLKLSQEQLKASWKLIEGLLHKEEKNKDDVKNTLESLNEEEKEILKALDETTIEEIAQIIRDFDNEQRREITSTLRKVHLNIKKRVAEEGGEFASWAIL